MFYVNCTIQTGSRIVFLYKLLLQKYFKKNLIFAHKFNYILNPLTSLFVLNRPLLSWTLIPINKRVKKLFRTRTDISKHIHSKHNVRLHERRPTYLFFFPANF